jgi:hypothetical protein
MSERESFPGGCLCGAVRYVARGPLRDVLICHCVDCRRFHGGPGAYTALPKDDLELVVDWGLHWRTSPESDAAADRGFCGECGSSLFWDPPRRDIISIAAGTLDQPTGLRVAAHWFVSQAADYDMLPDDGLPRHERSAEWERGAGRERGSASD